MLAIMLYYQLYCVVMGTLPHEHVTFNRKPHNTCNYALLTALLSPWSIMSSSVINIGFSSLRNVRQESCCCTYLTAHRGFIFFSSDSGKHSSTFFSKSCTLPAEPLIKFDTCETVASICLIPGTANAFPKAKLSL